MRFAEPDHYDLEEEPENLCESCGNEFELIGVAVQDPPTHWPAKWCVYYICSECEMEYDWSGNIVRDEEEISNVS